MGTWNEQWWESPVDSMAPRRARRSGPYRSFVPFRLTQLPLVLSQQTGELVAAAEAGARRVSAHGSDLSALSRFLLRSEAIASSQMEGIAPSARQVALAELGQSERVEGVSEPARLVAQNMTVVQEASTRLVTAPRLDVEGIVELHRSLLVDDPAAQGVRTRQNWIGGSSWSPLDADFVPPAPERVGEALDDLIEYANAATHSAIVQAALVHAQFETIHPFADGNGRVGRALIHTVFARRGAAGAAMLPISMVLATLRDQYVEHLQEFRREDLQGVEEWIAFFARATLTAAEQAGELAQDIAELREEWGRRVAEDRARRGARRTLRSDSGTAKVLQRLIATPVLTAETAQRIHGLSASAARTALEELSEAGVLSPQSIGKGRQAFSAREVLDLITIAERALASTQFDTRLSPPRGGAPARPGS